MTVVRVFEGFIGQSDVASEDGGMARIAEVVGDPERGEEFVRICSYSEDKDHPLIDALTGRGVRVTIEVED
jgi:hypothetical protein